MGAARPLVGAEEAGRQWREDRMKDFRWRVRALEARLGEEGAEAARALLEEIEAASGAVSDLAEAQAAAGRAPWWADGEYDSGRADAANDSGLARFRARDFAGAAESFREAVRLAPQAAAHHVNLGKALARAGDARGAASALREGARRRGGPTAARGWAALAATLERDGRWAQAGDAWREARENAAGEGEPGGDGFKRKCEAGLVRCAAGCEDEKVRAGEEAERHRHGVRGPLPFEPSSASTSASARAAREEAAATDLIAARETLRLHPGLLAPCFAEAEALIRLRRWGDAEAALNRLPPGADSAYLAAELLWRRGDLPGALAAIEAHCRAVATDEAGGGTGGADDGEVSDGTEGSGMSSQSSVPRGSRKLVQLWEHLVPLNALRATAEKAAEAERWRESEEHWRDFMDRLDPEAGSGARALAAAGLARALCARLEPEEAVVALEAALEWEPESGELLLALADVHRERGAYELEYLALDRALRLRPSGAAGLAQRMTEAARRSLNNGAGAAGGGGGGRSGSAPARSGAALLVLGVPAGASALEVRRAYRRLAAKWHPDKWAGQPEGEKAKAKAAFAEVCKAYEELRVEP